MSNDILLQLFETENTTEPDRRNFPRSFESFRFLDKREIYTYEMWADRFALQEKYDYPVQYIFGSPGFPTSGEILELNTYKKEDKLHLWGAALVEDERVPPGTYYLYGGCRRRFTGEMKRGFIKLIESDSVKPYWS